MPPRFSRSQGVLTIIRQPCASLFCSNFKWTSVTTITPHVENTLTVHTYKETWCWNCRKDLNNFVFMTFLSSGSQDLFPLAFKCQRGVNMATHLHLQPRIRMRGVYVHASTRLDAAILYKVLRQLHHRYLHFLRISQGIVQARQLKKGLWNTLGEKSSCHMLADSMRPRKLIQCYKIRVE
jgi:hypothetical protein